MYEMLTGLPPFYCRDREKLFEKIRKAELTFPKYVSENAKSVLTQLLCRDPDTRLGSGMGDAEEVKQHPFFAGELDWDGLLKGEGRQWREGLCRVLGGVGAMLMRHHLWFSDYPPLFVRSRNDAHPVWPASPLFLWLYIGMVPPPWEPTVYGSLDTSQFDKEFTSMPIFSPDVNTSRYGLSQDNTFEGFTFTDDSYSMMTAGIQKMRGGR